MYSCTNQLRKYKDDTHLLPHLQELGQHVAGVGRQQEVSEEPEMSYNPTDDNLSLVLPANFLLVEREIIAVLALHGKCVEVKDPRYHLGVDQAGERRHGLLLVDEVESPGVLIKESREKCSVTGTNQTTKGFT